MKMFLTLGLTGFWLAYTIYAGRFYGLLLVEQTSKVRLKSAVLIGLPIAIALILSIVLVTEGE
ncbi:hypothetical protein LCGC14_0895770 [marine sediment metagenome]|uniref:Uncharacterized protein n=1 Tax=marine sediment metagenome TaxID=412755 RepID=A0A0F9NY14_9ZZZZ